MGGLALRITVGPRLMISPPCPLCGSREGHMPDCPHRAIADLQTRQRWLDCPSCSAKQVDRNDDDLWECRACHLQYLNVGSPKVVQVVETDEVLTILDDLLDQAYDVWLVKEKGTGKFSIDQSIAAFDEQITQIMAAKRKRPRRRRTMSIKRLLEIL